VTITSVFYFSVYSGLRHFKIVKKSLLSEYDLEPLPFNRIQILIDSKIFKTGPISIPLFDGMLGFFLRQYVSAKRNFNFEINKIYCFYVKN